MIQWKGITNLEWVEVLSEWEDYVNTGADELGEPPDIISASSVGIPAINQKHNLVVIAPVSISFIDSPTVTQKHNFNAQDITSTLSVDNPTVTLVYSLTTIALISALLIDTPNLDWVQPDVPAIRVYTINAETRIYIARM